MNRSTRQLIVDGVVVPADVIAAGGCAAYVSLRNGECAVYDDRAYCPDCGQRREFYDERCGCGAVKPWLYRGDVFAEDEFGDLD